MYDYIPEELKQYKNWICYKAEPRPTATDPDHVSKIPKNPYTGGNASSKDPNTWGTFIDAVDAVKRYDLSGIGFNFENTPFFGVDIDGKAEEIEAYKAGNTDNVIGEFIHGLQSYSEYSRSGKGIHIMCRGELPKVQDGKPRRKNPKYGVEMYEDGRYFVVTGDICAEYAEISDCTETIKPLYNKYMTQGEKNKATREKEPAPLYAHNTAADMSDHEIEQIILKSKQGEKYKALMQGDKSAYIGANGQPDESSADLALCNILAFYTQKDPSRIDRMFRRSALMRDKWDRKTGNSTYGQMTIDTAIRGTKDVYKPKRKYDDMGITIGKQSAAAAAVTAEQPPPVEIYPQKKEAAAAPVQPDFHYQFMTPKKWDNETGAAIEYKINPAIYLEEFKLQHRYFIGDDGSKVYLYKDGYYQPMKQQQIKYIFDKDIERIDIKAKSTKAVNEFYDMLLHTDKIVNIQEESATNYINFQNGLLNFDTFEFTEHTPDIITVNQIPCKWNGKESETPVFDKYLSDLFEEDEETKVFIQTFMGLIISNVPSRYFKKSLLMVGKPDTGKSQLRALTEKIIGERNAAAIDLKQLEKPHGTSGMYNKRLCGCSDMKSIDIEELPVFKQATGGDLFDIEPKFGDHFSARFNGFFWFTCNKLPRIKQHDQATYNRFIIIECNNVIPPEKRDKKLLDKLTAEIPGIVYKCLQLARSVVNNGYELHIPPQSDKLVEEYMLDNDPLSEFLKMYTEKLSADQKRSDGMECRDFETVFNIWNKGGRKYSPQERNETISDYMHIDRSTVIYKAHGHRYLPFVLNEEGQDLPTR